MATRSYVDVAPTAATMALNAYIFGYGGHSLVTPHQTLKQLWWTDQRIEAKVTRAFIISKLRGEEREFLHRQLAFGEGLTDDTYMEWILEKAQRLFLILAELGVPDQIFGCIDDSWDDDDLPVSLENVQNLDLSFANDEVLNKRFHDMQYVYLLRELKQGNHFDYGPNEHIPMDHVNTIPPAVCLQVWDRIHLPKQPDNIFTRRKYSLSHNESGDTNYESFIRDIRKAQALPHEHIASIWGSYTSKNTGYMISDFVGQHTLGTFIEHRTPMQYLRVTATNRPSMLCQWMHCLTDALASLHYRGVAHTAIRPSNILIDNDNHIVFADVGSIRTLQRGKHPPKTEAYNYAAPEQQISKTPHLLVSSPPISSRSAISKLRKMSHSTSGSSTGSSQSGSVRSNSLCTVGSNPLTSPSTISRTSSITTPISNFCSYTQASSPSDSRNFSRRLASSPQMPLSPPPSLNSSVPPSPTISTGGAHSEIPPRTLLDPESLSDLPTATPEQSDIYSLACVMLEIVSFLLRGKLNDFVKHRSTRISSPENRNKLRIDSSFHANPDKITSWVEFLLDESEKQIEPVYRGLPSLLELIRRMMAQNPNLRPPALEVRNHLAHILTEESGIQHLCCANREWSDPPPLDFEFDLPKPPTITEGGFRDSIRSTHSFTLAPVLPSSPSAPPYRSSSSPISVSTPRSTRGFRDHFRLSRTRDASTTSPSLSTRSVLDHASSNATTRPDSRTHDHCSPPRLESRMSIDTIESPRARGSSIASTATAKLIPWRRVFSRNHS